MSPPEPPGAQSVPPEVYTTWKALPGLILDGPGCTHTKKGSAFFNMSGLISHLPKSKYRFSPTDVERKVE